MNSPEILDKIEAGTLCKLTVNMTDLPNLGKRLTERHTQGVARSPLKRLNNGFARLFAAALAFAVL